MSDWRGNIEREMNGSVLLVGHVSKERAIYDTEKKTRYFFHISQSPRQILLLCQGLGGNHLSRFALCIEE